MENLRLSLRKEQLLQSMVSHINKVNLEEAKNSNNNKYFSDEFVQLELEVKRYPEFDSVTFISRRYWIIDGKWTMAGGHKLSVVYDYDDIYYPRCFGKHVRFVRAAYKYGMSGLSFGTKDIVNHVEDFCDFEVEV